MNITKSTTTLTCPHCNTASTYDLNPHELADGRKLVCGKCGRDIAIDRSVFEKVEEILEHPPASSLFSTKTVVKSSMSFQCPRCGKTTTTDMTIGRLIDGEKVFCSHCGNEIHADGAKIQEANNTLRGIAATTGGGKTGTPAAPGSPVVVKTKTFSFNVNKMFDIGKTDRLEAGGLTGHTPILTPRRVTEPRQGCLGVMAVFALLSVAALIYGFWGW